MPSSIDEAMTTLRVALDQVSATKLEELRIDLLDTGVAPVVVEQMCDDERERMLAWRADELQRVRRELAAWLAGRDGAAH